MGQFAVILAAAGRSTRFGDPKQKKIYAELEGRAVWLRALDPFLTHGDVEQIIVAIAPEDRDLFERRYHDKAAFLNLDVVDGGAERSDTGGSRARACSSRLSVRGNPRRSPALPDRRHGQRSLLGRAGARRGIAGNPGQRHDQARGPGPLQHRDGSSPQPLPGADPAGVSARLAGTSLRPALPGRGRRHRRHPARRGPGPSLRIVQGSTLNFKITTQEDLKLAGAMLHMQANRPRETCGHPFADEAARWAELPKLKASDLFDP